MLSRRLRLMCLTGIICMSMPAIASSSKSNKQNWVPEYEKTAKTAKIVDAKKNVPQIAPVDTKTMSPLALKFYKTTDKAEYKKLSTETLAMGPQAVPDLVQVMKGGSFPIESRWVATILLARVMGSKSSGFIAKFIEHPHYILRMASLKALLGLKDTHQVEAYRKALKDPSLMVRLQALDNISLLGISELGPNVWEMLLDKQNYQGEKGKMHRSLVIKKALRTIGDINYRPALAPLGKLIQKNTYHDVFAEIEYGLEKLTGKKAPEGDESVHKKFWATI